MTDTWILEGARTLTPHAVFSSETHWPDPALRRVVCPQCGDSYVHITRDLQQIDGGDNYDAGWGGRGDLLLVPLRCAAGEHAFEICLAAHKGRTYSFVRVPHKGVRLTGENELDEDGRG
jgi:hypothetical protein